MNNNYSHIAEYYSNIENAAYFSDCANFAKDWHLRLARNMGGALGRAKGNVTTGNIRQAGREVENLVIQSPKAVVDEVIESGREARRAVDSIDKTAVRKALDSTVQNNARKAGRYLSKTQGSVVSGYVDGTKEQVINQAKKTGRKGLLVAGGVAGTGLAGIGGYTVYDKLNNHNTDND